MIMGRFSSVERNRTKEIWDDKTLLLRERDDSEFIVAAATHCERKPWGIFA